MALSRKMLLSLIAGLCLVGLVEAENKPGWAARFNIWCCKNLGFGCNATRTGATRSDDTPRPKGGSLMEVDVNSHAVSTLWKDCDCWSPVPTKTGSLAVATSTGIWNVPLNKPETRQLVFPANDVLELLGTEFSADGSLLLLRSSKTAGCKFEPWKVNSDYSQPAAAKLDASLDCGTEFNFQSLVKPAQVSATGTATTVLYRGRYEIDMRQGDSIHPLLADQTDRFQSFDPVWINSSSIAFVTHP